MNYFLTISLILIKCCFQSIFSSKDSIIVLTPNKWYFGNEQTIYFDTQSITQNQTSTIDFSICLANLINDDIKFNFTQTIFSNTSQLVKFFVPSSFRTGYYILTIVRLNPIDGYSFKNITKDIYFNRDLSSSIYITTDKSTYKPCDTVNIRISGLDSNFLPLNNEIGYLRIQDPELNIVYQKLNLKFENGFIEDVTYQLSDRPIYGRWSIRFVTTSNEKDHLIGFEVKEYVLPKFSINLELPKFLYKSSTSLKVAIEAKYTYGKNVDGKLKIDLISNGYNTYRPDQTNLNSNQNIITYLFELSSTGKNEFKLPLSLVNTNIFSVGINATVFDQYSGESRSSFSSINVYDKKIYSTSDIYYFKPNQSNTFSIKIHNPIGEPYVNEKLVLYFEKYNENYIKIPIGTYKLKTDSNGKISKTLFVDSNITELFITISFANDLTEKTTVYFYKYYSYDQNDEKNKNFMIINSDNQSFKQNEIKKLFIKKNNKLLYQTDCISVKYLIISRSIIRDVNDFNLCNYGFNLSLELTYLNLPKTNILFYHVDSNKNVFVQNYLLETSDLFRNYLNMSFNSALVSPGDSVNLTLRTNINSTVSLCIIDQSVRLLSTPNEITKNDIKTEIDKFNLNPYYPANEFNNVLDNDARHNYYWEYPQAVNDFHTNGLIVLTDYNSLRPSYYNRPVAEEDFIREPLILTTQSILTTTTLTNSQMKPTRPANLVEVNQVRRDFSETWVWKKIITKNETTLISSIIPDTITSWVATGYSLNPLYGMAVAQSINITTFKGFFVSIQLPYCIKRGEILILKAIVFNYLSIDLTNVIVTFVKTNEFQQIKLAKNNRKQMYSIDDDIKIKIPYIKSQTGHTVKFVITPTKIGLLKIQINAQSNLAADAEIKQLLVKSEGVEQNLAQSILIDASNSNIKSSFNNISISLPNLIVPDSQYCQLQLVGDILGTAFNNLNNLLNIPFGCGEQNMIGLTPNIYALKYLLTKQNSSSNVEALIKTAKQNIQTGYSNELKYRHLDGSFSAFGQSDISGSSWLTAFVLKSFSQANKYILIDENILNSAAQWLINQQQDDGSFNEPGNVIHKDMQSGANNRLTLTAYILISLFEANLTNTNSKSTIQKATYYIESKLNIIGDDVYASSLVAYALDLSNSKLKKTAFDKFNSFANRTLKDKTFWTKNEYQISNDYYLLRETPSSDIEMTSYGLLIHINNNYISRNEIFKIAKWIISKSNYLGSYSSTQNTILALQALSEFSTRILPSNLPDASLAINVTVDGNYSKIFHVDNQNSFVLQSWKFPYCPNYVSINSTGSGVSLVQIITIYNVPKINFDKLCSKSDLRSIILTQGVVKLLNYNSTIVIRTCIKYNKNDTTGMSLIESELVSGFDVDDQAYLNKLSNNDLTGNLMLIEKVKNTNKIAFYLKSMPHEEYCIEWEMTRLHQVADVKSVTVSAYDYYASDVKATIQFNMSSEITNLKNLINN